MPSNAKKDRDRLDELAARLEQITEQMEQTSAEMKKLKIFMTDYDAKVKTPQEMISQSKNLSKKQPKG